jgi:uncharacterized protein YyaL (SSP411 family)
MVKKNVYAGLAIVAAAAFVVVGFFVVPGGKNMSTATITHKYTNKLINESSPYLLQHAHNPVDWYPWSKEAFEIARKQDKPIFLSIGYSTCHWCHVMERESFTNERIAEILNEHFISIKVDREQRPDIDSVYMNAVRMMTGGGGWPLSVFLTSDGKPFYGGTYFPPTDTYGRPGFDKILLSISDAWKNDREKLVESAGKISEVLSGLSEQAGQQELSDNIFTAAFYDFQNTFDTAYGGFGRAPKFPQPSNLSMLLGYWSRTGDKKSLAMVEKTLEAMAEGGIYDHIGGGFHRYSTDARWLVPHFEKMLYDQALVSKAYVQAYQATGNKTYAGVAKEIFDYVLRDMTDDKAGFYSAEDADSEGREGTFYVWEPGQIENILGPDDAGIFNEYYGVIKGGNFEEGKSILNVTKSIEELAIRFKKDKSEIENILERARSKLLEHRAKRPRPHLDDKVISAWNGMMISSLAYGGTVLGEEKYVAAAGSAAEFVLAELRKNGRLMRYYRNGKVVGLGFLDDYAFMISALLDLYEATFDAKWLLEARNLADEMIKLFSDEEGKGFFLTGSDAEKLIVRNTPSYDSVVPSGNSAAALALLKLGRLTMEQRFTDRGGEVLQAFSGHLAQSPASFSAMIIAMDFWLGPTQEIVVAGNYQRDDTKRMIKVVREEFLPNSVVLLHEQGEAGKAIEEVVPFVKSQTAIDNKSTAYVCENYVCKRPVNNVEELKELLAGVVKRGGSNQDN